MNRLALDIWVCQSNILRFQYLRSRAGEDGERRLLDGLLAQEEDKLRELHWTQERRWRLVRLVGDGTAREIMDDLLDDSLAIMGTDMGNIQLVDARSGDLRLMVSRGLPKPFLDFFATVHCDDGSACGWALASGMPVLVEDVERSPIFAGKESGRVMREAGALAVQSFPLFDRNTHLLGMISTHWRVPTRPSAAQVEDLNARINVAMKRLP